MDLKVIILRKLLRLRYIGGKHTDTDNLSKGLPSHLKGDAKKAAEELAKEGLLWTKPTSYGLHVSLNPNRIEEIYKIVEEK